MTHRLNDTEEHGLLPPQSARALVESVPAPAMSTALAGLFGDAILSVGSFGIERVDAGRIRLRAECITACVEQIFATADLVMDTAEARQGLVELQAEASEAPLDEEHAVMRRTLRFRLKVTQTPSSLTIGRIIATKTGFEADPFWWPPGIAIGADPRSMTMLREIATLWPEDDLPGRFLLHSEGRCQRRWSEILPWLLNWASTIVPVRSPEAEALRRASWHECASMHVLHGILTRISGMPAALQHAGGSSLVRAGYPPTREDGNGGLQVSIGPHSSLGVLVPTTDTAAPSGPIHTAFQLNGRVQESIIRRGVPAIIGNTDKNGGWCRLHVAGVRSESLKFAVYRSGGTES